MPEADRRPRPGGLTERLADRPYGGIVFVDFSVRSRIARVAPEADIPADLISLPGPKIEQPVQPDTIISSYANRVTAGVNKVTGLTVGLAATAVAEGLKVLFGSNDGPKKVHEREANKLR